MKITNKHKLPEAVVNFLSKDHYTAGDNEYSVTTLLKPPQIVQLERRYADQLEEDAMDRIWSIFGHGVHSLLETNASEEAEVEDRYYADILGCRIGGQIDHYRDGIITDYKVTSAWTLVYGSRLAEWEEQLNCYAYLMGANGKPVEKLQIAAILRDWDKNKAKQNHEYPQAPMVVLTLGLWSEADQATFLKSRVIVHQANKEFVDSQLCPCFSEEMWEQPTKYAVKKVGAKRATKVFDNREDARVFLIARTGYEIEVRKGKRNRCEDYCSVKNFCHQWKAYNG